MSDRAARSWRRAIAAAAALLPVAGMAGVVLALRHQPASRPVATARPAVAAAATPALRAATPPRDLVPVTPAPGGPITLPADVDIVPTSAAVVWVRVADQALFRSTDSGATWQRRPLPPGWPGGSGWFIDGDRGWMEAGRCPLPAPVTLWRTVDAGATWQRVATTGLPATAACGRLLSFEDALHGYQASEVPDRLPTVYRTADGGRSWTAGGPLPTPPGLVLAPGTTPFASQLVGFGATLLLEVEGNVFRSTDGGASWAYAGKPPTPGVLVLGLVSATRWFAVPGHGMLETLDAGATWHAYSSDYEQAAPIAPWVTFGSPLVGYATVHGSIQRTLDGGHHWTLIHTPGT